MAKDTVKTKIKQEVDYLNVNKQFEVDEGEFLIDGVAVTTDAADLNSLEGAGTALAALSPGKVAVGTIYITANVADEETVTIGDDVYEFDRAVDGVTAGRIAVTAHADDTPANATDALIAKINASGTEAITAIDIGTTEILLVADAAGAVVIALAETMAGVGNIVSSAAMASGEAITLKKIASGARVPLAVEVTLDNVQIALDFVPVMVQVQIRATATGIILAWDGDIIITGGANPYITLNNDGAVDWDTGDTIHWFATD